MEQKLLVRKYEPSDFNAWNAFVADAKNSTFLFNRDFMEYHSDRFTDYSLMIFDENKLIAILPAHVSGEQVSSHFGLTYGGLVLLKSAKLARVIAAFQSVLKYLHDNKISSLRIKNIPPIYHQLPSDEQQYALFLAKGVLERRDSLSVIDLTQTLSITKTRRESIRRGAKNGLAIREEANFEPFWNNVLIPNLAKKHQAKPVHSLAEIQSLQLKFPSNIRHFNVYQNEVVIAGTTVFVSDLVAHPQYVSGTENKNETGALDFLYHHLITEVFADKRYFDFGISNEDNGTKLNEGLVFWKESFGARTITQDFYEVLTANHVLLNNVLI
ncbi:MAG TPA: GNAT family N-acetyltransferase [Flavobacterium sp.]|nr:GNAT family N-acetyltransferase [Flavobacterium sp.]